MAAPPGGVDTSSATTTPTLSHTETQDTETTGSTDSLPLHLRPDVLERLEKDTSSQESTEGEEKTEEALDSDQVIELQTFIDRKTWIEEKIQLLEKMPPVEVFVGMDALRVSAEVVPGLATREELKRWIIEHDAVEKETEIFDSGELTKLRKFTKAATQRHLSPADTDLIELTLTTIYELDKLLHLLRGRSEHLDLLGIRLDWEDARIAAWRDRRKILEDIRSFLENHARWSPSAYESYDHLPDDTVSARRGSIASVASDSSTSPFSAALSRAARFKLSERLSREAAQLSGRISVLRHSRADTAGKALDKLIDSSRKPVPDELLDEQDRVEEQCIGQFEGLGDFVMEVITQWRKADEIYIETMKDSTSAQALSEELEVARLQHPIAKQSALFCARADALLKRLKMRGNPSAPSSDFPCPVHQLIEDQHYANEAVVQKLSAELAKTLAIVKKVDLLAKEYRETSEVVSEIERLANMWSRLAELLAQFVEKLSTGIPSPEGDGSPPELVSQTCLENGRHATFLALFPSMQSEHDDLRNQVEQITQMSNPALRRLERPGISSSFKAQNLETFNRLLRLNQQSQLLREEVQKRVEYLRVARAIWADISDTVGQLIMLKHTLDSAFEAGRWRDNTLNTSNGTGLSTPESIVEVPLPSSDTPTISTMLGDISSVVAQRIQLPLEATGSNLGSALRTWLTQHLAAIQEAMQGLKLNLSTLDALVAQASTVNLVGKESQGLQIEIENLKLVIEGDAASILAQPPDPQHESELTSTVTNNVTQLRKRVHGFIEDLPNRVPFVARTGTHNHLRHTQKQPSVSELPSTTAVGMQLWDPSYVKQLPFDLNVVDASVRSHCNSVSMTLSGALQDIDNAFDYFQSALVSARIDAELDVISRDLREAFTKLENLRASLATRPDEIPLVEHIYSLQANLQDTTTAYRTRLSRSSSITRQTLQQLTPQLSNGSRQRNELHASRSRVLKDVDDQYSRWNAQADALANDIATMLTQEISRQEQIRIEQESANLLAEKRAQEEAEALRLQEEQLEKERLAAEEREKKAHEEEARQALLSAQERAIAEEAERLRVKEATLAQEWVRFEEERSAAEAAKLTRVTSSSSFQSEGITLTSEASGETSFSTLIPPDISFQLSSPFQETQALPKDSDDDKGSDEDIFSDALEMPMPSPSSPASSQPNIVQIRAHIHALRKRLTAIDIQDITRPTSTSILTLPSAERAERVSSSLRAISDEAELLPPTVADVSTDTELRSFRSELQSAAESMDCLNNLVKVSEAVEACDTALSNLLDHIDSFPRLPILFSASQVLLPDAGPEEQLKATSAVVQDAIHKMVNLSSTVSEDPRVQSECTRIQQTWSELKEMVEERLAPRSRPPSTASAAPSSGRDNSVSRATGSRGTRGMKRTSYGNLSIGASRGRLLSPTPPASNVRRVVSGSQGLTPRPPSQLSTSSTRSVSGTLTSAQKSTYASRQRTTSITGPPAASHTHPVRQEAAPIRRPKAPSVSSSTFNSLSRSTGGTFSRAARLSFSSPLARPITPSRKPTAAKPGKPAQRKPYVADPKNKLDVAVGSVVNNLPVNINVEVVEDTWKDQSGKYWIGDEEPKLCFCRILRSQTVMVRVGGGWTELSKFIQEHFADAFRLLAPESPPRAAAPEEKWISSKTLLEAADLIQSPPRPPKTPEPRFPFPSSFPRSPGGESPHSVHSTPSKGSPLTPLQYIRRAGVESPVLPPIMRPGTPSKVSTLRPRLLSSSTSSRNSVWRP